MWLNLGFLPKVISLNFANQYTDLAAFSKGEPEELSLLFWVLCPVGFLGPDESLKWSEFSGNF